MSFFNKIISFFDRWKLTDEKLISHIARQNHAMFKKAYALHELKDEETLQDVINDFNSKSNLLINRYYKLFEKIELNFLIIRKNFKYQEVIHNRDIKIILGPYAQEFQDFLEICVKKMS